MKYVFILFITCFSIVTTTIPFPIRLVPFIIIVLVLEEIIPLIALYAPGMLPSTCVLPAQRERIDAKKDAGRRASKDHYAPLLAGIAKKKDATLLRTLPSASEAYCGYVCYSCSLIHRPNASLIGCSSSQLMEHRLFAYGELKGISNISPLTMLCFYRKEVANVCPILSL
jgi:hypothetical protein